MNENRASGSSGIGHTLFSEERGFRQSASMKISVGKFTKIFVAVIGGNAVYYLFEDRLPDIFHHKIFSLDWGLLLDFWLCIFFWVILDLLSKLRLRRKR